MSGCSKSFLCDKFYDHVNGSHALFDTYTAASLGDISYFMRNDAEKLASKLSTPNLAGWTPLMYACSRGHSYLVNYLLMCGVRRDCKSKSGVTPLMLAISSGNMSTVEAIFDFINLEEKDYRKWTPLFYAVHFTREKCLKYLLDRGADVNIVDFQNETPLMAAIKLGRETMVELLIKSAKNLDVVSYKQESALMLASESNNEKIQTLVRNHYLKSPGKTNELTNVSPTISGLYMKESKYVEHCSPVPIKQQRKVHFSLMKMRKSLTYSPNRSPVYSPSTPSKTVDMDTQKFPFYKKFWSPQPRPHNNSVENFLKALGLEKYWPIFRDEEVDFETLLTLNEENLKELGIQLFGPRKKIFKAIQQLRKSTKNYMLL